MRTTILSMVCLLLTTNTTFGALFTFTPPTVTVGPTSNPSVVVPTFVDNLDGTYTSVGSASWPSYEFTWDMTVDPDPFVSAAFSVTNNAAVVQTFVVGVLLPIVPQLPFTVHGGSVGLSLTDANFNGDAELTDAGFAVYQGEIDGVPVLDLLDDPYTLSTAIPGFTVVDSDFDGLPGPTLPSGAALATIGITHTFTLTPGDKAAFTSFFVVEAIPEASTLALYGVGLAVLAGYGARNRGKKA